VTTHRLAAQPDHCFWGFFDRDQPPVLVAEPGDEIAVEALTHHAGDAPDLLMDDGVRAVYEAITERGPGVHVMTGPIDVAGVAAGEALAVHIHELRPRLPYGATMAAHWGALHDRFQVEWATIWGLVTDDDGAVLAEPQFQYDVTKRPLYDSPGWITQPDDEERRPFSRRVRVPVRPHFGVIGVAPAEPGRRSSVPPGVFGGNVDQWRTGAGTTLHLPVFRDGAGLFVGDPHLGQGDGEVCGTAIEASLDARITVERSPLEIDAPVLETPTHWYTHGFSEDLDVAMRQSVERLLALVHRCYGLTDREAYALASVAADVGVTQVVDGNLGCHAGIAKALFA
jgi:acetamidase/formamidase